MLRYSNSLKDWSMGLNSRSPTRNRMQGLENYVPFQPSTHLLKLFDLIIYPEEMTLNMCGWETQMAMHQTNITLIVWIPPRNSSPWIVELIRFVCLIVLVRSQLIWVSIENCQIVFWMEILLQDVEIRDVVSACGHANGDYELTVWRSGLGVFPWKLHLDEVKSGEDFLTLFLMFFQVGHSESDCVTLGMELFGKYPREGTSGYNLI